jgi:hypothetical protein
MRLGRRRAISFKEIGSKSFKDFAVALVATLLLALPAQALEAAVEGDTLYLEGEVFPRELRKMTRVLRKNPDLRTVVLLDVPGSNDDHTNAQIIRLFRNAGLNTHLRSDSFVASGGTDLFLAGVQRTMRRGAVLGVHSWSDGRHDGASFPKDSPEHRLLLDLYAELGIPAEFYWFTLTAAPAEGMHYLTEAEILRFGLVTQPITGAGP